MSGWTLPEQLVKVCTIDEGWTDILGPSTLNIWMTQIYKGSAFFIIQDGAQRPSWKIDNFKFHIIDCITRLEWLFGDFIIHSKYLVRDKEQTK